jgi:hypothetical protein
VVRTLPLVVLGGASLALGVACGSARERPSGGGAGRVDPEPVVSATIPVGERGQPVEAVAAGEEGVWVAGGGECPGSVWRIDPKTDRVVAGLAVDNPHDLAVGGGAGPPFRPISKKATRCVTRSGEWDASFSATRAGRSSTSSLTSRGRGGTPRRRPADPAPK